MSKIYHDRLPKATVCHKNTCITVHGETARLVNTLALVAALVVTMSLIAKVTR